MTMPYYINLMSNLMDTQLGENMLLFQSDNLIGDKILWGCKYLQMDKIVLKLKMNGRMEILILLSPYLPLEKVIQQVWLKFAQCFRRRLCDGWMDEQADGQTEAFTISSSLKRTDKYLPQVVAAPS